MLQKLVIFMAIFHLWKTILKTNLSIHFHFSMRLGWLANKKQLFKPTFYVLFPSIKIQRQYISIQNVMFFILLLSALPCLFADHFFSLRRNRRADIEFRFGPCVSSAGLDIYPYSSTCIMATLMSLSPQSLCLKGFLFQCHVALSPYV